MNQKELNEIRRRVRPDRNNIGHIYGCYVNSNGEIISRLDVSLALATHDEQEMFLTLLKKSISGSLGRNLLDIPFSARQVMEGEAHKLLSELRNSRLQNENAREEFYRRVIACVNMEECNYVILLGCDVYDVPFRGKDRQRQDEASRDVFPYILCAVCPVKDAEMALRFFNEENAFHGASTGHTIAAPTLGFMFPTFDDRQANIYNALFYTHDPADNHQAFVDTVFRVDPPMTSVEQNETFHSVLGDSLETDCRLDVVQAVHEQISGRIQEHKESHDPDPLELTAGDVTNMLVDSGVSPEKAESFRKKCAEEFGENAVLNPNNIINKNRFEIATEEVTVSVKPEFSYLVETRIIDEKKYILIPADGEITVNGVPVCIPKEEE